jgi:hypothetical protein
MGPERERVFVEAFMAKEPWLALAAEEPDPTTDTDGETSGQADDGGQASAGATGTAPSRGVGSVLECVKQWQQGLAEAQSQEMAAAAAECAEQVREEEKRTAAAELQVATVSGELKAKVEAVAQLEERMAAGAKSLEDEKERGKEERQRAEEEVTKLRAELDETKAQLLKLREDNEQEVRARAVAEARAESGEANFEREKEAHEKTEQRMRTEKEEERVRMQGEAQVAAEAAGAELAGQRKATGVAQEESAALRARLVEAKQQLAETMASMAQRMKQWQSEDQVLRKKLKASEEVVAAKGVELERVSVEAEVRGVIESLCAAVEGSTGGKAVVNLREEKEMLAEQLAHLHERIAILPDFYVQQIFCPEQPTDFFEAMTGIEVRPPFPSCYQPSNHSPNRNQYRRSNRRMRMRPLT